MRSLFCIYAKCRNLVIPASERESPLSFVGLIFCIYVVYEISAKFLFALGGACGAPLWMFGEKRCFNRFE